LRVLGVETPRTRALGVGCGVGGCCGPGLNVLGTSEGSRDYGLGFWVGSSWTKVCRVTIPGFSRGVSGLGFRGWCTSSSVWTMGALVVGRWPVSAVDDASVNILYTVNCTLDTVYCTLYAVYCTLYTVYCTLDTVYCAQYTVYCMEYLLELHDDGGVGRRAVPRERGRRRVCQHPDLIAQLGSRVKGLWFSVCQHPRLTAR